MKEKIKKTIFIIATVISFILYGLGFLGIIFGATALLAKNISRGIELLIGGAIWLVINFIFGFIVRLIIKPNEKIDEKKNQS